MQAYDVVIIGAGHNGLTCAAYLARAGLKAGVFERRSIVGGACVTEEFHPGFRNSTAAYTVSLLHPRVIADLGLHQHGLRIVARRAQNFLPILDGGYLIAAEGRTEQEIAKFSRRDAERHADFNRQLDAGGELLSAMRLGNRVRRLPADELRTLYDLFTKSAGDYLDGWFESDLIKALHG